MLDMEGIDLHAEEFPLFPEFKIAAAGTQFLPYAVVAVYTFMDLRGRINRQMHALAQRPDRAYMIRMIVRDEYAHDIRKIQTHLAQTLLYLPSRDARVYENTSLTRTEIVAVSTATARKTSEYKSVFLHITNSACKGTTKIAYMQTFAHFFRIIWIYHFFFFFLRDFS